MTVLLDHKFTELDVLNDWELIKGNPSFVNVYDGLLELGNDLTAEDNLIVLRYKNFIAFDPTKFYRWRITCYKNFVPADGRDIPSNVASEIYFGFEQFDVNDDTFGGYNENIVPHGLTAFWGSTEEGIESGDPDALIENTFIGMTNGTQASFADVGEYKLEGQAGLDYWITRGFLKAQNDIVSMKPMIAANVFGSGSRRGRWFVRDVKLEEIILTDLTDNQGGTSVYTLTPDTTFVAGNGQKTFILNASYVTDGVLYYTVESLAEEEFFTVENGYLLQKLLPMVDGTGVISFRINYPDSAYLANAFKITIRKNSHLGAIVYESTEFDFYPNELKTLFLAAKNIIYAESPPKETGNDRININFEIENALEQAISTYDYQIKLSNVLDLNILSIGLYYDDTPYMIVAPGLVQTETLTYQLIVAYGIGDIRIVIGQSNEMLVDRVVTVKVESLDADIVTPDPNPGFELTVKAPDDFNEYGLETFDELGNKTFTSTKRKALGVLYGQATIENNNAVGTTYVDVTIAAMTDTDAFGAVVTPTTALPTNCNVSYQLFAGYLRLYFKRDTTYFSAPTSVTVDYQVIQI